MPIGNHTANLPAYGSTHAPITVAPPAPAPITAPLFGPSYYDPSQAPTNDPGLGAMWNFREGQWHIDPDPNYGAAPPPESAPPPDEYAPPDWGWDELVAALAAAGAPVEKAPRAPAAPRTYGGSGGSGGGRSTLQRPEGYMGAISGYRFNMATGEYDPLPQRSSGGSSGGGRSYSGGGGAAAPDPFYAQQQGANLAHSHEIHLRQIPSSLAGRGILNSGELGYQLGEENRSYNESIARLNHSSPGISFAPPAQPALPPPPAPLVALPPVPAIVQS